ncbi:SDR family NAD(P)-dependent oxidoreductase [Streptomyces sp. NPDC058874]|uniref:SDR family NAD(P)-dependent oxidoreductase n=1 Tax=unclassified Streptomyces TaxID=2593676 RepID=UPI00368E24C0
MPTPPVPTAPYDLTGRTALVTGAASGIGRATAVLLAAAGAHVHCADRDAQGLGGTAALITEAGGRATAHPLDVTDRASLRAAVSAAGPLDIAAAIAGIMHTSSVLETADEDLDRVLEVNFKGVLRTCQEAARSMIAAGRPGSIVTMASGAVDAAQPGLLCYSAAKAAVVQLTRTLATEAGPHGIRVNAVAPGWIRTPMTGRHGPGVQEQTEAALIRMSPLRRVGEPEDIARAVLYLASEASSFVTGQILRPNGGVSMPW